MLLNHTSFQSKRLTLKNLTLTKRDVSNLLERLQNVVRAFGENEANKYIKPLEMPGKEWARDKDEFLANAFNVTTNVNGNDTNFEPSIEGTFSKNSPNVVTEIRATNATSYRAFMKKTAKEILIYVSIFCQVQSLIPIRYQIRRSTIAI